MYRTIPCQFCEKPIRRVTNVSKGTCFDCRTKQMRERDAVRLAKKRADNALNAKLKNLFKMKELVTWERLPRRLRKLMRPFSPFIFP